VISSKLVLGSVLLYNFLYVHMWVLVGGCVGEGGSEDVQCGCAGFDNRQIFLHPIASGG
jgi:hypothetical protein